MKLSMAPLFLLTLLSLCFLPSCMPKPTVMSFPLTHRDAEGSLIRSHDAERSDLPEDMPMRNFVASGRAMRGRVEKQRRSRARHALHVSFSYLQESVGEFYLNTSVGTPPQPVILILDTGSELLWTQCTPCKNCVLPTDVPPFSFHKSSSYMPVPCTSPLCTYSPGFKTTCSKSTGNCEFTLHYGDGSTSAGYMSFDSFHLGGAGMSKSLLFGCAVNINDTVPVPSSGLMGLSAGSFSFTSQLFMREDPKIPNKFAYCLPDRLENLDATGTILFGQYRLSSKLRYTPLVPPFGPLGNVYYFVKLEGISVGKTFIKNAMEQKGLEVHGTIFDSGTALTGLQSSLYVKMVAEFRRQTRKMRPFAQKGTAAADVCYRIPWTTEELPKVPLITMHFGGGVKLELGPGSVLYPYNGIEGKEITLCLAFETALPNIPLNIIGNYQQQNYWVEYNLQDHSLGLAKAKCATK